jgi:hypothetical protein
MSENVEASRNPKGIHSLYRHNFTFISYGKERKMVSVNGNGSMLESAVSTLAEIMYMAYIQTADHLLLSGIPSILV